MYEIWKILGENSSQIQIILAIIAIFFAIKASYYVKFHHPTKHVII